MLHDIAPHTYSCTYEPKKAAPGDIACYFDASGVYLDDGRFPTCAQYPSDAHMRYLFDYDDHPVYLCLSQTPPNGCLPSPLRSIRSLSHGDAFLGGTAQHLWNWYVGARFCGRCAAQMEHSATERAMVCPDCGNIVYPRISPAVIVLITCGDKILLGQGRNYSGSFYSLIAGYLEIGESLEQAAHREVMEETGLAITNLRYFGNQPWPFSGAQMVGFFAEADDGQPLRIQYEELSDVAWFSKDTLPQTASGLSIAGAMIDAWQRGVTI